MNFPDTVDEYMEQYKMTDTKQVYSNGIEYVPIFRMKQWFEHEKAQLSKENTTKDAISRQAAIDECNKRGAEHIGYAIAHLPTVQPEVRTGKWTLGFDNKYMEKYYYCSCCGGRKYGEHEPLDYFCSNCGADMRGEQDE